MSGARHGCPRPIALLAALIVVAASIGIGGTALADPGHINGKAVGHKTTASHGSGQASTTHSSSGHAKSTHSKSTHAKSSHTKSTHAKSTKGGGSASTATASSSKSGGNLCRDTGGDCSKAQQPSKADQNSGGANGGCPGTSKGDYCSTRNGAPSGNGNGKGKATGKPCAGCVGKADNKNPHGQFPNGSDPNKGYECDSNHGIGRSNPAHTGCSTPPSVCKPLKKNNFCGSGTPPPCKPSKANNFCGSGTPPTCKPTKANNFCGNGTPPTCKPTKANQFCGNGTPPTCKPTKANQFCSTVKGRQAHRPPPAVLQPPKGLRPPVIKGVQAHRPPAQVAPAQVAPAQVAPAQVAPAAGTLPNTGAPGSLWLAALGGLVLVAGGGLLAGRKAIPVGNRNRR